MIIQAPALATTRKRPVTNWSHRITTTPWHSFSLRTNHLRSAIPTQFPHPTTFPSISFNNSVFFARGLIFVTSSFSFRAMTWKKYRWVPWPLNGLGPDQYRIINAMSNRDRNRDIYVLDHNQILDCFWRWRSPSQFRKKIFSILSVVDVEGWTWWSTGRWCYCYVGFGEWSFDGRLGCEGFGVSVLEVFEKIGNCSFESFHLERVYLGCLGNGVIPGGHK